MIIRNKGSKDDTIFTFLGRFVVIVPERPPDFFQNMDISIGAA